MKFARFTKVIFLAALLTLGACAQPEDDSAAVDSTLKLDMSKGPNKVTGDDYALQPVPTGDQPLASVDAAGRVAPFGQASRAEREVAAAAAVAVTAAAVPAAFAAQCTACHGADAKGVEGLGLDLTASNLVAEASEAELVEFLKVGRLPNDPASVTGIPMPGFAWMDGGDLTEIAVYLKSL